MNTDNPELAWQNIKTAEIEFLQSLADKGGLSDPVPGMLRHCAKLLAARDPAMLAAAPALPAVDDAWQPIETAPRMGVPVLVACEWGVRIAGCIEGQWWSGFDAEGNDRVLEHVTNWMPLPPPPATDAQDDALADTQRAIIEAAELRGYRRMQSEMADLRAQLVAANEYAERCTESNSQMERDNDALRAQLAAAEENVTILRKAAIDAGSALADERIQRAAAEAERDRAAKDAERYRFLRDKAHTNRVPHIAQWPDPKYQQVKEVGLDAAIDAAIASAAG